MTRFATRLIFASLFALGCNRTPSLSQDKSQSNPQPSVPVEQQTQARQTAGDSGAPPGSVSEQDSKKLATAESLKAEIDALKAAKPAWREIAWKSCLLEGLKESRAKNKPALLWVFVDRPIDDARC